jgi:hypothetical protein
MDLSGEVGGVCLGIDAQHSIGATPFATARRQSFMQWQHENSSFDVP